MRAPLSLVAISIKLGKFKGFFNGLVSLFLLFNLVLRSPSFLAVMDASSGVTRVLLAVEVLWPSPAGIHAFNVYGHESVVLLLHRVFLNISWGLA